MLNSRIYRIWIAALVIGPACASSIYAQSTPIINEDQKLIPHDVAFGSTLGDAVDIHSGVVAVGAPGHAPFSSGGAKVGAVFLYDDLTGDPTHTLFAFDGSADDSFGSAVSTDLGLVAVGAWGDDDNGSKSGSAYMFVASTGQVIHKFVPTDGAEGDHLGYAVAIGGFVVACGAKGDDDNGSNSGSVYLYSAFNRALLHKLFPDDAAAGDEFGVSVAIDGELLAVGARYDDDNGTDSGSVYLFETTFGQQLLKLTPDDGAAEDLFGTSVDIDNGVVVVGAFHDDDNGENSGSVYLFDAATGIQIAKLLPDDGAAGDSFGYSVDLDNGVVVVGAHGNDDNGLASGATYLFDAATGAQLNKLLATDAQAGDNFGFRVAIDDGVVVATAWGDDDKGSKSGAAYLFDTSTGTQSSKLRPYDDSLNLGFGNAIDSENNLIVVGASGDDYYGQYSGAVYFFEADTGVYLYTLRPYDAASFDRFGDSIAINTGIVAIGARSSGSYGSAYLYDTNSGKQFKVVPSIGSAGDDFGTSVALENGILAVGSPLRDGLEFNAGAVFLFDAATLLETAIIQPDDLGYSAYFGMSVAMHNGLLAVGARDDDDNGSDSGSVYVFDATTGTMLTKLLPDDGAPLARFGSAVAIHNGVVVVGARGDSTNSYGTAYLFDALTGAQIAKLNPSNVVANNLFGYSVSIDNGVVAIGMYRDDDNGTDSGSVYLFDASTGDEIAKLLPSDGEPSDYFGRAVALDNGRVFIGAGGDDDNGSPTGAAYIFTVPGPDCPADTNADGFLDNGDIGTFIALFLAGDLASDFNADGFLDNGDIGAFIILFLAGC